MVLEENIPLLASPQLESLLFPISEIKPFPRNYNKHPPAQITKLIKSINQFGWVKPISANLENEILAGHGMVLAALEAGYTHVPVIFYGLDPDNSKGYVVADNRLAQLAEPDTEILNGLLDDLINIPDFDIEAIGYDLDEVDTILNTESNPYQNYEIPEDSPEYNESIADEVDSCECPKCGYKFPKK